MKKQLVAAVLASILALHGAFAINVNENELKSANGDAVVFQNYSGPHSVIETADAIRGIGVGLGRQVNANPSKFLDTGSAKYSIIHAIDPDTQGKLDADILVLGAKASVDHIKNLRRIIAGYLASAYGYSDSDASTLATFVTVYNAVYRKNLDYFKMKYKDIVIRNISAEKCGLSLKWNEWPGASQIVIPLGDFAEGGLSSIDTSVISDNKVIDSMREEDDRGIDERKNMVDIKEREAEEANEKAQAAAKDAAQKNKELTEQKQAQAEAQKDADKAQKDADKAQKDADEAQDKADEAQKKADENPGDKQAQKDAAEAQEKADEAQTKADEAQAKAEEAQKKVDEEKSKTEEKQDELKQAEEEAAKEQEKADKKQAEANADRNEIAKDQQELIQQEIAESADGTVVGLKLVNAQSDLTQLVKINSKTGKVSKTSPVSVIRNRTIIPVHEVVLDITTGASMPASSNTPASFYMAVCGSNEGKGAVKLCLIDEHRLEIQKESNEVLSEKSMLVTSGSGYYVIIKDEPGFVTAKYDKNLVLQTKSSVAVMDGTPITITSKGIIVTGADGVPVLLSMTDLTQIKE